jgi:hypothetical protein
MIARRIRGRLKRKMNKKLLTALLLPLMLLPLMSFGYAHWGDTVEKRYKLRPGTVEVHIIQWHIDSCTSYDINCNGDILGDELQIVPQCDDAGEVISLWIQADPIFPCWELELKMLVHVKGRLAVRFTRPKIALAGPFPDDPCFDKINVNDPGYVLYDWVAQEFPGIPWLDYRCKMWAHDPLISHTADELPCYDKSHYDNPTGPTDQRYKPCECVMIQQYIHLEQEALPDWPEDRLQEFLSCHWLRIDFEMEAENEVGQKWGSPGYDATYPGDWVEPYYPPVVPSNCP